MNALSENEVFFTGIVVGINMYQERILEAHRRGLPLTIDGELLYSDWTGKASRNDW